MAEEQDASAAPQWELKKENVAPVKKGVRDVGALNAALRAREGLRSLPGKEEEARKEERRYEREKKRARKEKRREFE